METSYFTTHNNWQDQIQELASQYEMKREEMEVIVNDIQHQEQTLEWLTQPRVQNIVKHRKGRWTQEEEQFSDFLSQEFGLGLADIDNGTTKRVYLSIKLACTKMRISKKYKGNNTGKEVFTKRTMKPNGLEYSSSELEAHKQRHTQLERNFITSVLKSELKFSLKQMQKKNSTTSTASIDLRPSLANGKVNSVSTAPMGSPLIYKNHANTDLPHAPTAVSHSSHVSAFTPLLMPPGAFGCGQTIQACGFMSLPTSSTLENIQEGRSHVSPFTHDADRFDPLLDPEFSNSWFANRFKPILPNPSTMTATAAKAVSTTPSEPSPTTTNCSSLNGDTSYTNSRRDSDGSSEKHHVDSSDLPDLLLGFDKLEDRPNISEDSHLFAGAAELVVGESPCITSRSFDDLHRHIGIGLPSDKSMPPLDLNHHPITKSNYDMTNEVPIPGRYHLPTTVGSSVDVSPRLSSQVNGFHQYPPREWSTSLSRCSSDLSASD